MQKEVAVKKFVIFELFLSLLNRTKILATMQYWTTILRSLSSLGLYRQ